MAKLAASSPSEAPVVTMMNKMAVSTTRKSPRKRIHTSSGIDDSPSERRKSLRSGDTIRSRPQLQTMKRKSQSVPVAGAPTSNRKDVYEVPDDHVEGLVSPHAGQAMQKTKSLKRQRVEISKDRDVPALPADSANDDIDGTPADFRRGKGGVAGMKDLTKAVDGISPRKRGRPRKPEPEAVETQVGSAPDLLTIPERLISANSATKEATQGDQVNDDCGDDEEHTNHSEDLVEGATSEQETDHEIDPGPVAEQDADQGHDPESEVTTRSFPAERMKSEAQAPDEEDIKLALESFEDQANLYGCRVHWAKMLIGARLNKRSGGQPISEPLRALVETVNKLSKLYAKLKGSNHKRLDRLEDTIVAQAKNLTNQVDFLSRTAHPRENSSIIKDIYTCGIPAMVFLLQSIVRSRYRGGELEMDTLGEIIWAMEVAHKLCIKAFYWRPRPSTMDPGVLGDTKNAVSISIVRICDIYKQAKRDLERPNMQQRKLELLEERRRLWNERQEQEQAELERRREQRQRAAAQWQQTNRSSPSSASQHARNGVNGVQQQQMEDIVDVDDIDTGDQGPRPQLNSVADGKLPVRPRAVRQQTEEIPGPSQSTPRWTQVEITALSEGLQEYRDEDRFERILDAYGDLLGQRDVDELMQQAKFFKQSMASQMEAGTLSGDWEWLKSVPG